MRTRLAGLLMVALALALAGCDDEEEQEPIVPADAGIDAAPAADARVAIDAPPAPDAAPQVVDVSATSGLTFSPANITISAGDTVRWTNTTASLDHTVTSGESSAAADNPGAIFDEPLPPGATVEVQFNTPGSYPYFCRPHEFFGMKGTVTVTQ